MKRLEKPIFIGGCGSSGTTLLRKMLNMHPNIACGPEMSVFDRPHLYTMSGSMFYTLWRNKDFDILDELCIYPIRVNPGNRSYFAFNREQYFEDDKFWQDLFNETESPIEYFDLAFSEYARRQGKKRWCEKTPNNIFCVDQIMTAFPDAKFIEVIRDGRDVVMSLVNRRRQHPMMAVFRWIAAVKSSKNEYYLGATVIPENYYRIFYEDLVNRPAATLRELCDFLGEDYDPIMLKYWQKKYNSEKEINDLGYGKKPVFKDSVGKWKNENANPTLKAMMELTLTDLLDQLGYEV